MTARSENCSSCRKSLPCGFRTSSWACTIPRPGLSSLAQRQSALRVHMRTSDIRASRTIERYHPRFPNQNSWQALYHTVVNLAHSSGLHSPRLLPSGLANPEQSSPNRNSCPLRSLCHDLLRQRISGTHGRGYSRTLSISASRSCPSRALPQILPIVHASSTLYGRV